MINITATLQVNGVNLWYKMIGRGPIILVVAPGWGLGSGLYQSTLAALSEQYTLVFHDPRGSGLSTTPGLDYATVNVGSFVDDMEALRRHLKLDHLTLLGHSHGGFIALNYALKFPGRVARLVLVDAQVGVDEPGEDLKRTLPALANQPALEAAVAAFTGPRSLTIDADLGHFLTRISALYFKDPSGAGAALMAAWLHDNVISLAAFIASSSSDRHFLVREKLAEIDSATLIMVGAEDFICSPVQARVLHDGIKTSALTVFQNSGHFCWIEEPALFEMTLADFMARP